MPLQQYTFVLKMFLQFRLSYAVITSRLLFAANMPAFAFFFFIVFNTVAIHYCKFNIRALKFWYFVVIVFSVLSFFLHMLYIVSLIFINVLLHFLHFSSSCQCSLLYWKSLHTRYFCFLVFCLSISVLLSFLHFSSFSPVYFFFAFSLNRILSFPPPPHSLSLSLCFFPTHCSFLQNFVIFEIKVSCFFSNLSLSLSLSCIQNFFICMFLFVCVWASTYIIPFSV